MSTGTLEFRAAANQAVRVRAHGTVVRQLGHTHDRRLADALRARRDGRYPAIDGPTR
ncbi:MAG: hypothetical protein ACLQFR_06990 [Streptosporangiaceae bacterium]